MICGLVAYVFMKSLNLQQLSFSSTGGHQKQTVKMNKNKDRVYEQQFKCSLLFSMFSSVFTVSGVKSLVLYWLNVPSGV